MQYKGSGSGCRKELKRTLHIAKHVPAEPEPASALGWRRFARRSCYHALRGIEWVAGVVVESSVRQSGFRNIYRYSVGPVLETPPLLETPPSKNRYTAPKFMKK